MGAALGNLAALQHHDLVDLIESLELVRDGKAGAALGERQQIVAQASPGFGIQVRGRLIENTGISGSVTAMSTAG